MIILNILGGLFVFMAVCIVISNTIGWVINQIEEARRPPPPPPKVEWDEDKPHWNHKP